MKIITKHLLKAFLGPLVACFLCFNALFIVFDLFGHVSKFIDMNVGALAILKYYGGMLSEYSLWFMPASCMLAALYTMWQLSRHSELTALRASGVSFFKLTLPFLFVSGCAVAAMFLNSELLMPAASAWTEQFKENAFAGGANTQLRTSLRYVDPVSSNNWSFAQADVSSSRAMSRPIGRVEVRREDAARGSVWMITTDKAQYMDGVWWFWNPQERVFTIDSLGGGGPESAANDIRPSNDSALFPTPMFGLAETPRDMVLKERKWECFSISDMRRHLRERRVVDAGNRYEYYYRLASPWSCVVITIFAIPAGISSSRQSMIKGVMLALASFFGFYALTLTLNFLGRHEICPPLASALLPNILFLAVGMVSYRRLV